MSKIQDLYPTYSTELGRLYPASNIIMQLKVSFSKKYSNSRVQSGLCFSIGFLCRISL